MTPQNQEPKRYILQRYLFMALDPIHVGTGGYRLGRVDNSIAREPGTRLPKIPGASLHGAARAYAAMLYETPECAGQSQEKVTNPAGNPVCYTFGYLTKDQDGNEQTAFSGVVSVFDAHILLFPVHSLVGPVWVSTPGRLREAGFSVNGLPETLSDETIYPTWPHNERLNLGWLMLDVAKQVSITPPARTEWQNERWQVVQNRIVLVTDALFGHIVNSNLEVRTSVSINPYTGAAEDGALFTYEALPRTTFLTAEVVLDDYRLDEKRSFPKNETAQGNPLPHGPWMGPLDVVAAGFRMMEHLGVGGMGTRGFGRLAPIGQPWEKNLLSTDVWEATQ